MTSRLEAALRAFPGRCQDCGGHVESQGHVGGCSSVVDVAPLDSVDIAYPVFARIAAAAVRPDGTVHACDLRPKLRGRIAPRVIGQCYSRAIRRRVLTEVSRERSDDVAGRNTNKLDPVYTYRSAA